MAHRILGIDLGAYSVKVVVAQSGLRQTTIVDVLEARVPAGDEPLEERAASALRVLAAEHGLEHDIPHWTMSGDGLSMRVMDFAFTGVKRADLDRAVGGELEGMLPHDLDDLVYDFEVMPRELLLAATAPPDAGLPVAEDAQTSPLAPAAPIAVPRLGAGVLPGTRLLAVATTKERVQRLLELGAVQAMEPRSLIAAPMSYARVVERGGIGSGEPIVVVDCGHAHTDVCVTFRGKVVFARSISRGGRHVTGAIARAWNMPTDQAEAAKHSDGFVASAIEPAQSPAWQRISDVISVELAPLARELRQTLGACRTQTGVVPRRVLLCGGGARLRGMVSWIGETLDLPVLTVADVNAAALVGPQLAARGVSLDLALSALGAALEASTGRPSFDLRKGEFSYRADFTFLRQKAAYLIGAAMFIVAFAAVDGFAAYYKVRAESRILDDKLKQATTELWGEAVPAEDVEVKISPKKDESPLPKHTAFDLLVEISKRVPPRDKSKLEIIELDIKKEKVTLHATIDNTAAIDEVEAGLKGLTCFTEFNRGKVTSGSADQKDFTLTITSKCI
jgi:Tfp pilus assembly PilM family ATPase